MWNKVTVGAFLQIRVFKARVALNAESIPCDSGIMKDLGK